MQQQPFARRAGIFLPVGSLSGKRVGALGKPAYRWIRFLKRAGQACWQVGALNPTDRLGKPDLGRPNAGNPDFIDLTALCKDGLLEPDELQNAERQTLLKRAHRRFSPTAEYRAFCTRQRDWLEDDVLFAAVRQTVDGALKSWPDNLRRRDPQTLAQLRDALQEEIDFYKFCQFVFAKQWQALKQTANQNGVRLIGDLSLYTDCDGVDVWRHPECFLLDDRLRPLAVRGVPDARRPAEIPLYNWTKLAQDGFSLWKSRFRVFAERLDGICVTPFADLTRFYAVPYGANAESGEWFDGPGQPLLDAIEPALAGARLIAGGEGDADALCAANGIPAVRVLQTAFESTPQSGALPCNCPRRAVAYTSDFGRPLSDYFRAADRKTVRFARRYLAVQKRRQMPSAFLRAAFACPAQTLIVPMQDWLSAGSVRKKDLSKPLARTIRRMTTAYNRPPE